VHAPSEAKSDDSKNSFYEELEQVIHHFPKYHMKILLGDFNAKLGRENIFKLTNGNESLHKDSNDNGVLNGKLCYIKIMVIKCTMFPHRNNHKITTYYLGYQIENEMGGACSKYGGKEKYDAYRVLVETPEGKRPFGRPRCELEDNIKKYLHEDGLD
jgi:hypothetical protein